MNYPTLAEVEDASHVQLARWHRRLPSPGQLAIGTAAFADLIVEQSAIIRRIMERLGALGGMTPEISKEIGW